MKDLGDYTDYAYNVMEIICKDFGPRYSSSKEEKEANVFIQKELMNFCDASQIEEFVTYPKMYPQGIFRIVFSLGLLAFLLQFLKYPFSIFASCVALLIIIIIILDFMLLNGILQPFFKKGISSNVYGIIKPKKEVKYRIILDGHTDSAIELRWARMKRVAFLIILLTVTILGIFSTLFYSIIKISLLSKTLDHNVIHKWFIFEMTNYDYYYLPFVALFVISFVTLFLGLMSTRVVMGANDNLSGSGVVIATGKYFSVNRLNNIELIISSTGSEEIGERGAYHFAKKHPELFNNSYSLVLECVGAGKELYIVEKDFMHLAKYSDQVVKRIKKAYSICKQSNKNLLSCKKGGLAIGSSNANMYIKAGYEAAFLIVQSDEAPWRPAYWHTREDTFDKIDKKILGDILGIVISFVKLVDSEYE